MTILFGTVIVSLIAFRDRRLFVGMLFEPFVVASRNQWYRTVSHAFIHADLPHLFVNMFVLYMFGPRVETFLGALTGMNSAMMMTSLYVSAAVVASIPAFHKHRFDPNYRSLGASGAVSAVLFAHILMFPTSPVYLFLLPVPIPSMLFGALYLGLEWYMDKRGGDGVAHDAHFFGAIYGVLFTAIAEPGLVFRFGSFESSVIG